MACSEQTLVTLKDGCAVSLGALSLLWNLEDRGFSLESFGDRLRVQPSARLTDEDVAAVRRYRDELLRLVVNCERM